MDEEQQLVSATMPVRKMATPRCAECVRQALVEVEGVDHAEVHLVRQSATVRYSPAQVTPQQLSEAVEAVGYEVPATVQRMQLGGADIRPERIETELRRLPGVLSASVDPRLNATVRHWDSEATADGIRQTLAREGIRLTEAHDPDEADEAVDSPPPWRTLVRWAFAGTTVVLAATLVQRLFPLSREAAQVVNLVAGGVAAAVVFGAGFPLYAEAGRIAARSKLSFSVYVTLSAAATLLYSAVTAALNVSRPDGTSGELTATYFEAATLLITFALFGRLLIEGARQTGSLSLRKHLDLRGRWVRVLVEGEEQDVPSHQVDVGDKVIVQPGRRIPVDGTVVDGVSAVDESMVTGESLLADKTSGAEVVSGSVNRTGRLVIEATSVRGDTVLSRIVKEFRRARGSKLPFLQASEHLAAYAVPTMLGGALATFLLWLLYGKAEPVLPRATLHGVAILIIGCPAVLAFAESLITAVAVRRAADLGVILKRPEMIELCSNLSYVLLDKTGTLTLGYPDAVEIVPRDDLDRTTVLSLAAAGQRHSDHPVARAILRTANREGLALPTPEDASTVADYGTRARVDGQIIEIRRWDTSDDRELASEKMQAAANRFAEDGQAVLLMLIDGAPAAVITVADPPKPEARRTVDSLHELGLRVALVTGDTRPISEHLGTKLGLDRVLSEVLPGEKTNETRRLQTGGEMVGVVGDGFNDAPALAQADVGIAMGSSEDIALEAADIALTSDDPMKVPVVLRLAQETVTATHRSTLWAYACHGLTLPVALGIVPRVEFGPALVMAAIAVSSLAPFVCARPLRRFEP